MPKKITVAEPASPYWDDRLHQDRPIDEVRKVLDDIRLKFPGLIAAEMTGYDQLVHLRRSSNKRRHLSPTTQLSSIVWLWTGGASEPIKRKRDMALLRKELKNEGYAMSMTTEVTSYSSRMRGSLSVSGKKRSRASCFHHISAKTHDPSSISSNT